MEKFDLTLQLKIIDNKLDQILDLLLEHKDNFIPSDKREPDNISINFQKYMKEYGPL